jgi:hypothetical protein
VFIIFPFARRPIFRGADVRHSAPSFTSHSCLAIRRPAPGLQHGGGTGREPVVAKSGDGEEAADPGEEEEPAPKRRKKNAAASQFVAGREQAEGPPKWMACVGHGGKQQKHLDIFINERQAVGTDRRHGDAAAGCAAMTRMEQAKLP